MKTNSIYCGDCHKVLGNMDEFPNNSIDLIYVDPPFFSNRHYEVIWGDGYELRAFEDRWKGGIENYIQWMEEKVRECHRVLKPKGSMYLHCDTNANAHLRILMDKIFGDNKFRNEIIWFYSVGGKSHNHWAEKHDTIFFYTKSDKWTFNAKDVKKWGKRKTGETSFGGKIGVDRQGRRYQDKYSKPMKKYYRYYLDEGKIPEDVWEIQSIQSKSKERLGYPTQKPESLLERIIVASSKKGDVVLDPMCGCGTALAVAQKLGRNWVGIDVSPTACKLMASRMKSITNHVPFIIGTPKTLSQIKNMQPFEFQNWVVQKLQGRISTKKTGDMGIDGYTFEGSPIQVKQSESIGRNVVDNFETALRRANKKKGIIVALSFGSGAHEEVARARNSEGVEITLKTLEELMNE